MLIHRTKDPVCRHDDRIICAHASRMLEAFLVYIYACYEHVCRVFWVGLEVSSIEVYPLSYQSETTKARRTDVTATPAQEADELSLQGPRRGPKLPGRAATAWACRSPLGTCPAWSASSSAFHGIVFSKGHHGQQDCVYVQPHSGITAVHFDVFYDRCGTKPDHHGSFYENTIVVQYGVDVIEAWDEAKRLRCEWHDAYEKSALKTPSIQLADLEVQELNFQGDSVGCWMEIQEGKRT
ncbi:hypothetical protein HPB47_001315 [Ixodes persulcatus]|uniref:Uncharacterized protein n=1 Tax=Ixodes persulcatus TaxID=34615 RepID=A0AC60PQ32_IXOPE|nr:hypothetical protein HPB47_001315 [Ixodes persulcatus]